MNKRKLSKLLNKEEVYTATVKAPSSTNDGNRIMLKNIKHKGKIYSDHSWIINSSTLKKIPYNSEIIFKATACMYNDKFRIRKQGLKNCKDFEIIDNDYKDMQEKETHDSFHYKKRKGKL